MRRIPAEPMHWLLISGSKAAATGAAEAGLKKKKAAMSSGVSHSRSSISRTRSNNIGQPEGTLAGLDQHVSVFVAANQDVFAWLVR